MAYANFPQATNEMQKITRQELADDFDKILSEIDEKKIGYIILNPDGSNGQILCPVEWFDFCFNDDFGSMAVCALRYAINRHTYMPSLVANFIRKYIGAFDTRTLIVMVRAIERELNDHNVDDVHMWRSLLKELQERVIHIEGRM